MLEAFRAHALFFTVAISSRFCAPKSVFILYCILLVPVLSFVAVKYVSVVSWYVLRYFLVLRCRQCVRRAAQERVAGGISHHHAHPPDRGLRPL